ncbi:hypothetical protein L6452_34491 [Arctium lappa]|uniref:Uncharacterized protein n=1 Tax=Arctium lappa TaxID=4217 RepID=A0ACB8YIY4_ARCLA|nr:hypothetical protein L6452_34491 [Arctium lappa]
MDHIKFSKIETIKFLYEIKWVGLILVLLLANGCAAAETANEPPSASVTPQKNGPKINPAVAIVLVCLLSAFLLICLFFFSFHRYAEHQLALAATTGNGGDRSSRKPVATRGLDPAVIAGFTSFTYLDVKEIMIGQQALECSVCLNEFKDYEALRLLPECSHVFHRDCIDEWLALHVTCPVCRASLVPKPNRLSHTTEPCCGPDEPTKGHVTIQLTELKHNLPPTRKIYRAHSMEHSMLDRRAENVERYTLRLPEEIQNVVKNATTNPSTSPNVAFSMGSSMKLLNLRSASVNSIRGSDYFDYERFDQEKQTAGQTLRITRSFISRGNGDSVTTSIRSSLNHLFQISNKDTDMTSGGLTAIVLIDRRRERI